MLHRCFGFGSGFVLAGLVGGCYVGGDVCKIGEVVECTGDGGCSGQQVCQSDGLFGACECEAMAGTTSEAATGPQVETSTGSTSSAATGGDGESSSGDEGGTSSVGLTDSEGDTCVSGCSEECPCAEEEICESGECVPCAKTVFKNTRESQKLECMGTGELTSVLYFPQPSGEYRQVHWGETVSVVMRPGELWVSTAFCCMVDINECAVLEGSCMYGDDPKPCACEAHTVEVSAEECGASDVAMCA